MSEERKKLLWISVSACVFGLVLIGAGFFLFAPKAGGATAPATFGNIAAPKAQSPQDFLSAPVPALESPQPTTTVGPDGSTYVIYGDEIEQGQGAPGAAAGAAPATAAKAPAAQSPSPQSTAPKAAAKPAGAQKTPAKAVSPAKAAPRPKSGDYWIQAASFTSRGRADDLKDGLSQKGIASHISVKDIVGKSWYRVRVGPYATKAEAEGWLGRLKALPQCAEAYVSKGD
jgi:DedD protein